MEQKGGNKILIIILITIVNSNTSYTVCFLQILGRNFFCFINVQLVNGAVIITTVVVGFLFFKNQFKRKGKMLLLR